MRRQSRAEPKRPYLVAADALVPQPQLDDLHKQRRNRPRLDGIDLLGHERGERFAVDPVLDCSSRWFTSVNPQDVPTPPPATTRPTLGVALCLRSAAYSGVRLSRPVSRAQRSTLVQRQTSERPSRPTGRGKSDRPTSTETRAREIPSRSAMSAAITSSVRESMCTAPR
jgi:hypothetical protein